MNKINIHNIRGPQFATNSSSVHTLLVFKDPKEIKEAISKTVDIVCEVRPIYSLKAGNKDV